MDSLAPQDIDMIAESGDEAMEDALYRDDDDEGQLIVEENIESTATTSSSVPAEVEMAPVDAGAVDDILEVEEEEEQGEGGVDIEVLPTAGEGEEVGGGGGEDVAFEDAETAGGEEESSSKVDGGVVAGEEIVLEEEPSKEEEEEGSSSAASARSTEPSTTTIEPTPSSLPLPASTSTPLSPEAEGFVIVEAPSDSETNGKEEARREDEVDPVENEESTGEHIAGSHIDEASESVLPEPETSSNYFSTNINTSDADPSPSKLQAPHSSEPLHPSHYTNGHHGDDEEDSFSSYSDASSSHFPSDFFLSTIVTYPSNSSIPTPSPYSLFQPFADEGADLPILLASNPDLFRAPLTELFDALREEGAFSVEDKSLNMEDEGGTLEWVLEHENEGVALVIGEDNKHAVDFSLQDLAKLHSHCGLGAPMRLKLRTGPTRFLHRVNKIQEIRREMDEELGSEHAEEDEGWVEEDSEHHEHIDEEEHFNSHHDHEELEGDGEMADEDLLGHELEAEPEHLEAAAIDESADIADDDEVPADEPAYVEPEQTDPEDYPNGPDDATAAQASTIDDPASEPIAEETELVAQDESEREPEPSIIEEATIVVTANEDIEIPSEAAPSSTDQGDFDTSAAGGLYDDDEEEEEDRTAHISDAPATEDVVDQEEVDTIAEVEKEAADATTSSEAVESVPVPPQFVVEDGEPTATDPEDVAPASEDLSTPSSTPAPAPSVSVPAAANAVASSSRRSTRLNPSSNAPSPAPTPAANAAPSLEVPDELYGDGSDELDLYADSPLPSKPVEDHLEEVEPLGLHEEADEDQVRVEDDEEEGDSDHTLAESIEDLVEVVIEVDGDAGEGSQTGGASPKRRFDQLEKDDASGEVVETIEARDLKRHKAA